MSSNRTKQQVNKKQPGPTTLRKIHFRIGKVKLILQEKDKDFYDKHSHLFDQLEEPRQRFIDTINLNMDDGTTKTIKLFLVQHNLAFGPAQHTDYNSMFPRNKFFWTSYFLYWTEYGDVYFQI